jgi:hypothetical protein
MGTEPMSKKSHPEESLIHDSNQPKADESVEFDDEFDDAHPHFYFNDKKVAENIKNGDSLPGLRELRLLSFAVRRSLSSLVYRDRIDPMSSYKLELDMRITDTVMGMTLAEGVIKHTAEQNPEEDENYQKMLAEVKSQ